MQNIVVLGGGIIGLWQAYLLARRGFNVRLFEASQHPFSAAASRFAGAMLAPYCESETAEPIIEELGLRSLALWHEAMPDLAQHGTLVVAASRDGSELRRFAKTTNGHQTLDANAIAAIEPDLDGRFVSGLHYPAEAHIQPQLALTHMMQLAKLSGVVMTFGAEGNTHKLLAGCDFLIDCRGLAARQDLKALRGVRGELAIIACQDITLSRPIRLLHPRFPIYVVPWPDQQYMIGATVIESDNAGPVTIRSALELLGAAYALHPAFGEAQIIKLAAGVRPAFADNTPKIIPQDRVIHVNGSYRHGYLLAPALAELVVTHLTDGSKDTRIFANYQDV